MKREKVIELETKLNKYFKTVPLNKFEHVHTAKLWEKAGLIRIYLNRSNGNTTKSDGYIALENGSFVGKYSCSYEMNPEIENIINSI